MCKGRIHSGIVPSSRLVDKIDEIAKVDRKALREVSKKRQNKHDSE